MIGPKEVRELQLSVSYMSEQIKYAFRHKGSDSYLPYKPAYRQFRNRIRKLSRMRMVMRKILKRHG